MTNNPSENQNENTAVREEVASENPVEGGSAAEMAAMIKEMQKQMKILQEKVDNGQTFSGPSAGKERPPVNGPRAGDEREKNKDSVRSDVDIAQADEKMAAPSENGVDDFSKDIDDFLDENGGEEEEEEEDKGSDVVNDAWVNEVSEMFDAPDENGPNMSESLANLVTKILSRRFKADKEEEITGDLKRPGNVPILSNPRVEEEIWRKLTHKTRRQDLALKDVGATMTKWLIKNARVVEKLSGLMPKLKGKVKEEVKEVAKDALNCFQIGAMTFNKLKQKRRDGMRDDLHPSYQKLCDSPKEEDGYLFGCDLDEKIKNINQAKRSSIPDKHFLGLNRFQPYRGRPSRGGHRQQPPLSKQTFSPRYQQSYQPSPRGRGQSHPRRQ